jgi:multimeric flavodoxin WrbA
MKIVSLLGSPRTAGNSSTIANHVLKIAGELGAETRSFELNRLNYQGCQACYACKTKLDRCVLKDDLSEVLAAVSEADAAVLASPVYYGDITSQLKGFGETTLIRACGIGPGSTDVVPGHILRQAEETARALLA